eukprot:15366842-Ditylum_brightwellii.AAC.2
MGKHNHKTSPLHPLKITTPSPPLIHPSHTAQKPQGTSTIHSTSEHNGIYGGAISTVHPPNMPGYKHCTKKIQVSEYLRNVYSDWRTSTLPMFAMYQDLMTKAVSSLDLPNDTIVHDKLEYYTLYHPINNLQRRLTMQELGGIKASILADSVSFAFLENDIMLVDRPEDTDNIDDTMVLLYDLPSETEKDLTNKFEEWVKYDMHKDLKRAVPSILQSDAANILHSYPGVKPLDFAAECDEGLMGLDITMTATPPLAQQPCSQEQHTQTLHKSKEVMKWCSSSKTNKYEEGDNDDDEVVEIAKENIEGSKIIEELLDRDTQLIPGTIDGYMHEGKALQWFQAGKNNSTYN